MAALTSLSDKELLSRITTLRRREHTTTLEILHHLNEIERRRLHLKLGYGSLFDYCTLHLKYSSSAAGRRIQVARCIRRYPECYELLKQNKVTLTTISLISRIVTSSNKAKILEAVCGKSQREVESIASQYRPPVALRDRVMPVKVQVADYSPDESEAVNKSAKPSGDGKNSIPSESQNVSGDISQAANPQTGSQMSDHSRSGSNCLPKVKSEQKLLIQFLADKDFMQKYNQTRSLLSQRLRDTSFANVFDALINEFLERHSPDRKKARREARTKLKIKADHSQAQTNNPSPKQHLPIKSPSAHSRHIPAALKDKIYTRDQGRCTFIGATGKRCGSTQALQIDHIIPFARGGATTADNLRLLCANHNRLEADTIYSAAIANRYQARE